MNTAILFPPSWCIAVAIAILFVSSPIAHSLKYTCM